jgi:hypothetical protein
MKLRFAIGCFLGHLFATIQRKVMCFLYWNIKLLRNIAAKNYWQINKEPGFYFGLKTSYNAYKDIHFISCDCGAIGLDYYAEKHGWKYEGAHFWSCPKCKKGQPGQQLRGGQ